MNAIVSKRQLKAQGQFIGGCWIPGDGEQFDSICPADQSKVFSVNAASASDVEQAFHAARLALEDWAYRPAEERIEFATLYAEAVKSKSDELAELISTETGKPLWESKTEVAGVIGKSAVSVDSFRQRRDRTSFEMGELTAVTRFKPYGVMGVLGPFNFPAHLPNGHIVPALIAGNTVIYKPSEHTPAVGQWMIERWQEIGLPDGVVNLVQGARKVGTAIADHRQIDGLLFTGSSAAGRALHQSYGSHPERMLALEMGGNNPLIVHAADDLEAAAYLTVNSAFITAGQRCTCARRLIIVDDQRADRFVDELISMMNRLRIGLFTDQPEPFAGTVISADQGRRLLEDQNRLFASGAKSLVEMKKSRDNDALLSPGLVDVSAVENRSDEEMFGPILSLMRVNDFDAAIVEANNTAYGLAAGLVSSSRDCYDRFIRRIRAGIVNFNRQTTGATGRMPFGGCGLSGNHRPSAWFAADYCSFPVASLESDALEMPDTLTPGIESATR